MRSRMRLSLLALIVVATAAGAAGRSGLAQDATPAAEPIAIAMLGEGMPVNAPGDVLELDRVTLAPGATIPPHVQPGAYVLWVESGDFGFTVIKGEAHLTRSGASTAEPIAAGPEVVGHAGDAFFENGGVVHTARNAGARSVVLLTAGLLMADMPSLQPTNDEGTPVQ